MKTGAFVIILSAMMNTFTANTNVNENISGASIIETSQQLLLQAKSHESTDSLVELIKNIQEETLSQQLKDDNYKKTF